jgi:hypothetical protein
MRTAAESERRPNPALGLAAGYWHLQLGSG